MQPSLIVDQQRHAKQTGPLRQLTIAGQELLAIPLEQRYHLWTEQSYSAAQYASPISDSQPPIYLFNVLVAMEWEPSDEERYELVEAFRNASEFLYNVTDRCMAFGQVVIGGQELMACADIQIMASNRFNPRSWVDGLRDPIKYTPIRVGRGIWDKNQRFSVPWKAEKSFHTLIHEWAHYALGLKDEYLKSRPVVPARSLNPNHASKHLLVDKTAMYQVAGGEASTGTAETVVVPTVGVPNGALMESVHGKELVPLEAKDQAQHYQQVWSTIKQRYPEVKLSGTVDLVKHTLPAELAHQPILFVRHDHATGLLQLEARAALQASSSPSDDLLLVPPADIIPEHCWIYVIKGDIATHPEQVIAQGTFEAESATQGFKLLNAEVNDWLVLIGNDQNTKPIVLQGQISGVAPGSQQAQVRAIVEWSNVTPRVFPLVDVISLPCRPEEVTSQIQVRVRDRDVQPDAAWLFPLGQTLANHQLTRAEDTSGAWTSQECAIASLDGHVLMRWNDGTMSICTFSQGGGPATHVAARYSPITAGSAEGNVMIFFKDDKESTSNTRVVTTLLHGNIEALPSPAEPRSYVFSLTSTGLLPDNLDPTLIMYFDAHAPKADGELIIHRLAQGTWSPMPTYLSVDHESSFAAMPMSEETAANLLRGGSGSLIEHYRLFWVPNSSSAATAP